MANFLKLNLSTLEIVLSLLIVLYLVFQMKTPSSFANFINHPMGMLVIVVLTIYLFLNVHPILGILLIIAAYELIRRSSSKTVKHVRFEEPTQTKKDTDMQKMNPPKKTSLEEDVISKMGPIKKSTQYTNSSYKPVSQDIHSALVLK